MQYVFSSSFSFCLISSRFWMYCYIPSTYLRQWSGLGNIGNCHYICSAVHLCISQILSLTCDSIHCFFPTDCCHIWKKYLLTKFCESNKVWWCYTAISIQWWTQYAAVRGQRSIIHLLFSTLNYIQKSWQWLPQFLQWNCCTPCSKKTATLFFGRNFGKWTPIFTILSLLDSAGNFVTDLFIETSTSS